MIRVLSLVYVVISSINAFSVCDDIDIYFLVDKDSLIHNYEGVATIMESIIEDGSSEAAAFSLQLYGNGLSDYQLASQLDLVDTFDTFRYNKSATVLQRLGQIYDSITARAHSDPIKSHDRALADVFDDATKQLQPLRKYRKQRHFTAVGYGTDHGIGQSDDENIYIIFDHFNKLVDKNGDAEICELFEYIGDHDGESIHFILGQQYKNMSHTFNTICKTNFDIFHEDLFFYLNKTIDNYDYELNDHLDNLAQIHYLSCPAYIPVDQYDGHLRLSAHAQWVDPHTIRKCHLEYQETNSGMGLLDGDKSFIYVNDHLYDDNTFKVDDYLIVDPKTFNDIKDLGCTDYVYKIINIYHVKNNIKKLYVGSPEHIMDYIWEAQVDFGNNYVDKYSSEKIFTSDSSDYSSDSSDIYQSRMLRGYENKRRMKDIYDEHEHAMQKSPPSLVKKKSLFQKVKESMPFTGKKKHMHVSSDSPVIPVHVGGKPKYVRSKTLPMKELVPDTSGESTRKEEVTIDSIEINEMADDKHKKELIKDHFMGTEHTWGPTQTGSPKTIGPITLTYTGEVTVTVKAGVDLTVWFEGKFSWTKLFKKMLGATADIKMELIGKIEATAEFTLNIAAELGITAKHKFSQTIMFPAFVVPFVMTPYVVIEIGMTTPKYTFNYVAKATYEQEVRLSYHIKKKKTALGATDTWAKDTSHAGTIAEDTTDIRQKGDGDKAGEEQANGFKMIRKAPTTSLNTTMSLTDSANDGNKCKLTLEIKPYISLAIGCRFYGIFGVEIGAEVAVPLRYKFDVESADATCKNELSKICPKVPTQAQINAVKTWAMELTVNAGAYVTLPNFFKILGHIYKIKKLAKQIHMDFGNILIDLRGDSTNTVLIKLKSAIDLIKSGVEKVRNKQVSNGKDEILRGVEIFEGLVKVGTGLTRKWKKIAEKRIKKAKKIVKGLQDILDKPLKPDTFGIKKTFGPYNLKAETKIGDCGTADVSKAIGKLLREQCCQDKKLGEYSVANAEFHDWYNGYDESQL